MDIGNGGDTYLPREHEPENAEPWERSLRRVLAGAALASTGHDSMSSRLVLLEHSESRDYGVAIEGDNGEDEELSALSLTSLTPDDQTKCSIYRANRPVSCLMDMTTASSSSFALRGVAFKPLRSYVRASSMGSGNTLESRGDVEDTGGRKRRFSRGSTFDGSRTVRPPAFPLERAGEVGDENLLFNLIHGCYTSGSGNHGHI